MDNETPLPPGQRPVDELLRFGLTPFATRFPSEPDCVRIRVLGDVGEEIEISEELAALPRVDQFSDFHCVTTWTCRALAWSGYRFRDVYEQIIRPRARPKPEATCIGLRGQDGARTTMELADLLADDVILADQLGGEPLPIAHGAPIRLVAPAHYGYKNVKYLSRIEFLEDGSAFRPVGPRFMQHPRARVALEERGLGMPGWIYRYLYRPLIGPTARRFRKAMAEHTSRDQAGSCSE